MIAELSPGPRLEQLFQGAEPAGQGDEGVAELGHAGLARMHAVDHFQTGQAWMADFGALQALRDDADDFAARGQSRIRHHSHQANRAATVNQTQTLFGEMTAEVFRRLAIERPSAGAGAAEHAN
ncbi:hypothetical protein D3C71_1707130 [compost metagenome]